MIGGAGGAIGVGFAVKLAADAEEMQSKFEAVFKEMSADAEAFALGFASKIGRSVIDTKKQLSEFQDVLVPLGFARKEAAELSKTLIATATDLASFNNTTDAQASNALLKALTGQRENLISLGIVLRDVDIKAELLKRGQKDLTGEAKKQAVALATLSLIQANAADAMGDAERTSGSFTNRMKALQGVFKDTMATIGKAFLPVLTNLASKLTEVLMGVGPQLKVWAKSFSDWSQVVINNWELTWDIVKNSQTVALLSMENELRKTVTGFQIVMKDLLGVPVSQDETLNALFGGPELANALKKQAELLKKMKGLKAEFSARSKSAPVSGPTAATEIIPKAIELKLPRGLIGFDTFAQKMQDAFLKTDDPQMKMLGLLGADKVAQKQQLSALETIAANTTAGGNNPTLKLAT